MNGIFVDALYWVAVINPKDQWHTSAVTAGQNLEGRDLVTTESVLIEVMNYFGEYGARFRLKTARFVQALQTKEHGSMPSEPQVNLLDVSANRGWLKLPACPKVG